MAVKFALGALFVVLFVAVAQGLKCNICLGSLTSDCASGKPGSSLVQNCEVNPIIQKTLFPFLDIPLQQDQKNVAQCVQVILKPKNYEKPTAVRACVGAPPNADVCKLIASSIPSEKCKACKDKDLCNSQPIGK